MSGVPIPRETGRYYDVLQRCRLIHASFVDFVVKQAFFGFLLFIIGLFRLYSYLTVSAYCNKQIKTVKSIKTIIGIKNLKTLKLT